MLTLTEAAGARLAYLLDEAEAPEDVAVRIVLEGRNLALKLDGARPDDATFAHEGRTVLLLDQKVSQLLADDTLDVEDTDDGPKLALL
ncbi:MAG: hypothetical protein ACE5JJ_07690 [Nitrospinota bacterium]